MLFFSYGVKLYSGGGVTYPLLNSKCKESCESGVLLDVKVGLRLRTSLRAAIHVNSRNELLTILRGFIRSTTLCFLILLISIDLAIEGIILLLCLRSLLLNVSSCCISCASLLL